MNLDEISADLLHLKRLLADQCETMLGVLENGAWARIPDPELRSFVCLYVADAVATLAAEVGASTAQTAAEMMTGARKLPVTLEEWAL